MFTDRPLLPDPKPESTLAACCRDYTDCSSACPGGAIPTKEECVEPTWDRATGKWSASNDHCGYPNDSDKCWTIWAEGRDGVSGIRGGFYPLPAIQCSTCTWACPFAKGIDSWIHSITKVVIGTTPILNSFFVVLDDFAGYGDVLPEPDLVDSFWTTPHQAYLLDNSNMGMR